MGENKNASAKPFDYGAGALVVLVTSIGVAAIFYSLLPSLNLLNLPAWIFGPLGVYTFAYSFIAGKNSTYYLVWGTVMVAIAVMFGFYKVVDPPVILGVLAILIAVIGIVAYQRSRK